jgi:hypothetical protein
MIEFWENTIFLKKFLFKVQNVILLSNYLFDIAHH